MKQKTIDFLTSFFLLKKWLSLAILFLISGLPLQLSAADPYECANPKDFSIIQRANIKGSMVIIGNSNICKSKNGQPDSKECIDAGATQNNNAFTSTWKDGDSNNNTDNSTAAKLVIPNGAKVLWAGLYWQGYLNKTNSTEDIQSKQDKSRHVKLGWSKNKGSQNIQYTPISADRFNWIYTSENKRWYYQGFKEITKFVQDHKNGWYWGADINTMLTTSDGSIPVGGAYGAWSIALIYEDDNESFKNITLFDGYLGFLNRGEIEPTKDYAESLGCDRDNTGTSENKEIDLSGFLTPSSGDVSTQLLFFAGEGDVAFKMDYMDLIKKDGSVKRIQQNVADSSISDKNGIRDGATLYPYYGSNNIGIDIDTFVLDKTYVGNNQYEATIKISKGDPDNGDGFFPGLFGFQTDLREVQVCFDYTYGQDGTYIAAPSINNPKIEGTFDPGTPLDVKLFLENNASEADVQIKNVKVNIDPIDTEQATYRPNSTFVKTPGGTLTHINETPPDPNTNPGYRRNIPVGDLENGTNAYIYYGLDLKRSDIDMPLNASINYTLSVDIGGSIITINDINTTLDRVNPCTATSQYQPQYGIFNVIHPNYHKSGEYYYYNLPTQVVGRVGNFKMQTMDINDVNEPIVDTNMSIAAIEMIDAAGFHYTSATCTDPNATVISTGRVWTITGTDTSNPSLSDIINRTELSDKEFFGSAIANAAFRISYNSPNEHGDLIQLKDGTCQAGQIAPCYEVTNFPDMPHLDVGNGPGNCGQDMDGNPHNTDKIPDYCGNSGAKGLDTPHLATCMECIYGAHTRILCSRDNFSIRPESYSIALSDMNQSDSTQKKFIADNMSGATPLHLAAGYKYFIDVNATDHNNLGPTPRYNAYDIDSKFIWSAPSSYVCNDEDNKTISLGFYNGHDDLNKSVSQAGIYTLSIVDNNWTRVDHNSQDMTHHVTGLFASGADCVENSGTVSLASVWDALNGCVTKSQHHNDENEKTYTDMNVIYHPYKFDLSSISLHTQPNDNGSWVYMNDLDKNKTMAATLEGNITAKGYDNGTLSNYTYGCMAQDILLKTDYISLPASIVDEDGNSVAFEQTIKKIDDTFSDPLVSVDANISFGKENFISTGDTNGSAEAEIYTNIKKPYDKTVNVTDINFTSFHAYGINDISNANLIANHRADGNQTIGQHRLFFFSRVAPLAGTDGKQIFSPHTTIETVLLANTYCVDDTSIGLNCSLISEFSGIDEVFPGGGGWYRTGVHSSTLGDGEVILLAPSTSLPSLSITPSNNIGLDTNGSSGTITISYPIAGRPVHPIIVITPDEWMKYKRNDPRCLSSNPDCGKPDFTLHFLNSGIRWKGVGHTGNVVETEPSGAANKRIGW